MKTQFTRFLSLIVLMFAAQSVVFGQSPLQAEINDRLIPEFWHYDNLESGLAEARKTGKPLLVTVRCVPCKACRGMDEQVVNPSDPELRRLMDQFVCVRLVQAWGLDLSLLQFDMNMSWAAFMLNGEGLIYGRYGTRAAQRNDKAITVPGFRQALWAALALHGDYRKEPNAIRPLIEGKRGPDPEWNKPDDIPAIQNTKRWGLPLSRMTGAKDASCIHCHFVPAAQMMTLMSEGKPITDRHLWAYPLPDDVGLHLDPEAKARVLDVTDGSIAARAGFKKGDIIQELDGQAMISIADVQWVLHQADDADEIKALVHRGEDRRELSLNLESGWRRNGEFISRASSWDFFKVKLFGINALESVPTEDRLKAGVPERGMALRVVKLSPSWGGMNNDVRDAGLKEGDIITGVDGKHSIRDHSELLAYLVQTKKTGESVSVSVMRDAQPLALKIPLNWSERIDALRSP